MKLTDEQIQAFYHRSYTAVDGLWFMKVEEKYGFEKALELDNAVWQIVPKIQARELKTMLNCDNTIADLKKCFKIKLDLEGFEYSLKDHTDGFTVKVNKCPWYNLLIKSNRQHIAEQIGSCICNSEYSTFASEFDPAITFTLIEQLCASGKTCTLDFRIPDANQAV